MSSTWLCGRQDGPVAVVPANVGGTDLSSGAGAIESQPDIGLRMQGLEHPCGIEPLGTRPSPGEVLTGSTTAVRVESVR